MAREVLRNYREELARRQATPVTDASAGSDAGGCAAGERRIGQRALRPCRQPSHEKLLVAAIGPGDAKRKRPGPIRIRDTRKAALTTSHALICQGLAPPAMRSHTQKHSARCIAIFDT